MSSDLVEVRREESRLVIVNKNVSRRNALSVPYYEALMHSVTEAEEDDSIRSIVLCSEGGYFCSGGDLNGLIKRRNMPIEDRSKSIDIFHNIIRGIRKLKKPVIAAVEGGAAGAGVSLAVACDFVVMDRAAKVSIAYVKMGLVPDGGATANLHSALPKQLLGELCMLGQPITADRLYGLGVVNAVTDADKVYSTACELADKIAASPARTIGNIKEMINAPTEQAFLDQLDRERDAMAFALGSEESTERIMAFLSKSKK
ncbi:oxepin-CoA hydrolase, alternative type [Flexibacterium corallicola]|uniref:oxepin-CoA hydrolase, alternative type n=1 Tax=Flexibacterium corallicola TaxID=3037259 RepID=UPI00286F7EF6|nr:enoyl-CoA hydratase family protein [Pseudovibrio sp. M1P-2-3]